MLAQRPCVLLVEDDPVVRRTLLRHLQPVARVVDVESAEGALTVLDTGMVFDAVLVDLALRGVSGRALFEVLRRRHPLVVSRFIALVDMSALEEGREGVAGVAGEAFRNAIGDRLLFKPIEEEELHAMVIAVAGSSDAAAE